MIQLILETGLQDMTHKRYANRVDDNQKQIVKDLRKIPGVSVKPGYDDLLVGFQGRTYWFEVKNPSTLRKDGSFVKGRVKDGQYKLQNEFNGHYSIVTTSKEIMQQIGVL